MIKEEITAKSKVALGIHLGLEPLPSTVQFFSTVLPLQVAEQILKRIFCVHHYHHCDLISGYISETTLKSYFLKKIKKRNCITHVLAYP